MRLWLLMLLIAAAGLAAAAETYRWVDKDGHVHYSDRPRPGAERIELESAAPGIRDIGDAHRG